MKMTKKQNQRKLSFIIAAIVFFNMIAFNANAQYDNTLYNLRAVPQTTLYNPAFAPQYKYHFGVPFLSSDYAGFGTTGPKYENAFYKRDDDSLLVDIDGMMAKLKDNNNFNARTVTQILNFGMVWEDWYFSASISDIGDVNMMYSKDMAELIAYGNASKVGETVDIGKTTLKAIHYREYALGASYDFDDQWNFGARMKFLFGKSAVDTKVMEGTLTTTPDYYYLTTESNITINTSLPEHSKDTNDRVTTSDYLFYGGNFGMGFDFGATYKLDDQWSFSASVLDIGWIQYDRYLQNYTNENVKWTYKGVDAMQFDGLDDQQSEDRIDEIKDSLIDMFQLDETVEKFKVQLTAKIYLAANYQLDEESNVGAVLRTEIFRDVWRPSLTLSYYRDLDEHFSVIGSYTMADKSYANIGLGVVAKLSMVQVYVTTDNFVGVFVPDIVKHTNFHFGINFIIDNGSSGKTMTDL